MLLLFLFIDILLGKLLSEDKCNVLEQYTDTSD